VGDFHDPLSPIDRSLRQKKNQHKNSELFDTINQINLTDIYRIFDPAATQYTFFSAPMELSQKRSYFRTLSKS
jgi:exonuclease III